MTIGLCYVTSANARCTIASNTDMYLFIAISTQKKGS